MSKGRGEPHAEVTTAHPMRGTVKGGSTANRDARGTAGPRIMFGSLTPREGRVVSTGTRGCGRCFVGDVRSDPLSPRNGIPGGFGFQRGERGAAIRPSTSPRQADRPSAPRSMARSSFLTACGENGAYERFCARSHHHDLATTPGARPPCRDVFARVQSHLRGASLPFGSGAPPADQAAHSTEGRRAERRGVTRRFRLTRQRISHHPARSSRALQTSRNPSTTPQATAEGADRAT